MDELNQDMSDNIEPKQEVSPQEISPTNKEIIDIPLEKKKQPFISVKRIILFLGIIFLVYILYSIAHVFVSPDKHIQQIYLVPKDAVFILQSSEPVKDWNKFSDSDPWKALKGAGSFEEIASSVESLDSIIRTNKALMSLVGKRDLMISMHKTKSNDWDALFLIDLQRVSMLDLVKEQIETVLKMAGNKVTIRKYKDLSILEMHDPATHEILYCSFVDNHFIASYTSRLVEASINERDNPHIGLQDAFIEAKKRVAGKGIFRLYINYEYIPSFMGIYLGGRNEYLDMFSNSMEYAGIYLNSDKEKMEIKGYSLKKEVADPYVIALLNSGKHKMRAHEILSARTAFYTNIGFNDPVTFVKELEEALSSNDKTMYDSYVQSRKKIENLFGISMEEHFLSWMSGEFAITQSEPGILGREPEMLLAIRAKNIKDARKKMEFIEKKVKGRTPITVKTVHYKKYDINYIEMKGFFRLFFGGLFDKFEKPYYTYINDYVVFSNKPSSILSLIEDYENKNTLKNDGGFKKSLKHYNTNSTLFIYTDMHKFYPLLQPLLSPATWKDLQTNKDVMFSFPYWSMQIIGEEEYASLHYIMDHQPYVPEVLEEEEDPDKDDKALKEDAQTEKELMSELKRFYVEKFQGNVLRDFYEDGSIKSEAEVKNGIRHGRYREYFANGNLRLRGKYRSNKPKGTWKYYTVEGKFERKEKFK